MSEVLKNVNQFENFTPKKKFELQQTHGVKRSI